MIKRRQQFGSSMLGIFFWGICIVFVALLAMKLIPAYTEFFTIQKILKDIGAESKTTNMSSTAIRDRYTKRAMIDNISTVKSTDLSISKDGGDTIVTAEYTYQTKLVGNVSLLVEFSASSADE